MTTEETLSMTYRLLDIVLRFPDRTHRYINRIDNTLYISQEVLDVFGFIRKLYNKSGTVPDIVSLKYYINNSKEFALEENAKHLYVTLIDSVYGSTPDSQVELAISSMEEIIMRSSMLKSMSEALKYPDDLTPLSMAKSLIELDKSLRTPTTDSAIGLDLSGFTDALNAVDREGIVRTPYPLLNDVTLGGFAEKELSVYMAATNTGKSWLLVHQGLQAIEQGKRVLHITLEMSAKSVRERYFNMLFGKPYRDAATDMENVTNTLKPLEGLLTILERGKMSTLDIEQLIDDAKTNDIHYDMIVVDYADLLKPVKEYGSMYESKGAVYADLRTVALDYKTSIVTATQSNREGIKKANDGGTISMDNTSDSIGKVFVADFVVSITEDPESKDDRRFGKVVVLKNRYGSKGKYMYYVMDFKNFSIEMNAEEDPNSENNVAARRFKKQGKNFLKGLDKKQDKSKINMED